MDDRTGQQFGNYRLIRPLGSGGFAEVYLGEHIHIQTQVAIKILSAQLGAPDLERFTREARTIASLEHPHIVRVFDFGIQEGIPFLVMNYAPYGTLRQRHPEGSRVALDDAVSYVEQIASALQYAHDRRVIHCDVKPENMLLGSQGEILLSDFGIAVVTATSTSREPKKTTAGTVAYMAPERIMGKPCSASDQYALAVIVYEWLCGEPLFQGSFFEVCTQHLYAAVPSLQEANPDISQEVEWCIAKALSKDPEERFASIQDFAQALQESSQVASMDYMTAKPSVVSAATPLPLAGPNKMLRSIKPRLALIMVACSLLFISLLAIPFLFSFFDGVMFVKANQSVRTDSTVGITPQPTQQLALQSIPTPTLTPRPSSTSTPMPLPVPALAPTPTPTPARTPMPVAVSLTVQITNIPNGVHGGDTVPVYVSASEPGLTVRLSITYQANGGRVSTTTQPQNTDSQGNATIAWYVQSFNKKTSARVIAMVQDQQGNQAQSDTVTVAISK